LIVVISHKTKIGSEYRSRPRKTHETKPASFDSPDIYGVRVETSKPYLLRYTEIYINYNIRISTVTKNDNVSN